MVSTTQDRSPDHNCASTTTAAAAAAAAAAATTTTDAPIVAPAQPAYSCHSRHGHCDPVAETSAPTGGQDQPDEYSDSDSDYCYDDDVDDDDDDGELLDDDAGGVGLGSGGGGGGGGGDLTKRYNRQREAAAGINKGVNSSAAARRDGPATDKTSALLKYSGRIRLDDFEPGAGAGATKSTDKSDRATSEQVLDPRTRMILLQLINRGCIAAVNGVISTGKEANVYHAVADAGGGGQQHRNVAIKVYKTAILAFRDRDRYVTGEHRFRHGYARGNPRAMVRLWAEKELRNLKRLHAAGLPVPEPLHLRSHVLVMQFVGDSRGWPAPRLRDAAAAIATAAGSAAEWDRLYLVLAGLVWRMYQQCRLVHADLSEYNVLYDGRTRQLWLIDVSQSVELDHPRAFEFLRMDIKNVNDFFRRQGVEPVGGRALFEFVCNTPIGPDTPEGGIAEVLAALPRGGETPGEEEVFRQTYIPRTLEDVYDYERDAEMVRRGEGAGLVYNTLLANPLPTAAAAAGEGRVAGAGAGAGESEGEGEGEDGGEDEGESEDEDADGSVDDSGSEGDEARFEKAPKGKKHADKTLKKVLPPPPPPRGHCCGN